jgi:hypothetical protein
VTGIHGGGSSADGNIACSARCRETLAKTSPTTRRRRIEHDVCVRRYWDDGVSQREHPGHRCRDVDDARNQAQNAPADAGALAGATALVYDDYANRTASGPVVTNAINAGLGKGTGLGFGPPPAAAFPMSIRLVE